MVILGIDPGTTRIGYGVIQYEGNNFKCLDYGIIKNNGSDKLFNFKNTDKVLSELIEKHKPSLAAVEKLYFFNNQKTVMAVSEMRGVIMNVLDKNGLKIFEFTPMEVKRQVAGYGRAEKNQVQKIVKLILGIKEIIKPDDAADALAIALCGASAR